MTHTDRTQDQQKKNLVLKRAISGFGEALDEVIGATAPAEADRAFYEGGPYPPQTAEDTWEEADSQVVNVVGGLYWLDLLVFFGGDETNRDYQIRFLIDGVPIQDVISKELKDGDDQIEYTIFDQYTWPPGPLTISIEQMIPGGGGAPSMTINRFRFRLERKGTP